MFFVHPSCLLCSATQDAISSTKSTKEKPPLIRNGLLLILYRLQLSLSDIELWNRFAGGDKEAFSLLFRRFYPLLFQYGSKIVADDAVVEDAIQELFAELWQKPTQQPLQSVKAYLLQALKFKLYKTFRAKKTTLYADEAEYGVFELSQETLHVAKEED